MSPTQNIFISLDTQWALLLPLNIIVALLSYKLQDNERESIMVFNIKHELI